MFNKIWIRVLQCNILHIEHAATDFNDFIQRIRDAADDKTEMWPQEEIDRLCVASVPEITRDGDLFCFVRPSSAFVVLHPSELKTDICRAHFVGIAFASQGIFDASKFVRDDAHDWAIVSNKIDQQAEADIQAFNLITNKVSNVNQSSSIPALSPTPSMSTSGGSEEDVVTNRPRKRTPPPDSVIFQRFVNQRDHLQHPNPSFQRHFDGPIKSLKLMFDIV